MTLTESSIYTNLRKLRVALYRAQFSMMKTNRVIYGTPLMQSSANAMKYFVLAFECKTARVQHLEECIGWFAVLRVDLEFCIEQNIIHDADTQKVEMMNLVADIDTDVSKWKASLAKGKTVCD